MKITRIQADSYSWSRNMCLSLSGRRDLCKAYRESSLRIRIARDWEMISGAFNGSVNNIGPIELRLVADEHDH